jgi:hypothetical protein
VRGGADYGYPLDPVNDDLGLGQPVEILEILFLRKAIKS